MSEDKNIVTFDSKEIFTEAFKSINEEIVEDQVRMIRDYLKGSMRLKRDLENKIEEVKTQISKIDEAIELMKAGDMKAMKDIKVPAKYLNEETIRLNDLDWRD